jgi:hypothetical protein
MKAKKTILLCAIFAVLTGIGAEPSAQEKIPVAEPLTYTRLFADSTGESHFEDIELNFTLLDFAPPAPPISVSEVFDSDKTFVISSPSDWHGDWHPAPHRQFTFVLSGELEVEVSDGEIRRFGPGSVALVEDTFGKGHISRIVSDNRAYVVVVTFEDK